MEGQPSPHTVSEKDARDSYDEPARDALQIEDIDEDKNGETTPQKYDIMYMPADYTLSTLYEMWKNESIVLPEFQRGYVWTSKQASRLIESFMMDLPVPPVFLMMDKDENALVIDGMQRLLTIFYFFGGHFKKKGRQESNRKFKIVGINKDNEIYGKGFDDLPEHIQKRLKNQVLRSILIRHMRPDANGSVAYHIFERLNTGGTLLSQQEIRNCIYDGKLNDLLHEINNDKDWRKILGKPYPDPRMNDIQLALRCMSLACNGNKYHQPMKDFLSTFMHSMRDPPDAFILQEKERFDNVCRSIVDCLGERPFHNSRGALKAPLLDSVFVAFARNAGSIPSNIKERVESLKESDLFAKSSVVATADVSAVKSRLEIANKVLFG